MIQKLKGHIPDIYLCELELMGEKYGLKTINRISHFISQAKHESANFAAIKENLNYSKVALMNLFPKYFKDQFVAEGYARQPEKIANRIYADRMGNGDETSGDGWKFRGRGIFQLTGKTNYIAFGLCIKEDVCANPDLLLTPKGAVESALWFWAKNALNDIADKGTDEAIVKEITKRINGSYHGLSERQKLFKEVYQIMSSNV